MQSILIFYVSPRMHALRTWLAPLLGAACGLIVATGTVTAAETEPSELQFGVSWSGNSIGTKRDHVIQDIRDLFVSPDGRCFVATE